MTEKARDFERIEAALDEARRVVVSKSVHPDLRPELAFKWGEEITTQGARLYCVVRSGAEQQVVFGGGVDKASVYLQRGAQLFRDVNRAVRACRLARMETARLIGALTDLYRLLDYVRCAPGQGTYFTDAHASEYEDLEHQGPFLPALRARRKSRRNVKKAFHLAGGWHPTGGTTTITGITHMSLSPKRQPLRREVLLDEVFEEHSRDSLALCNTALRDNLAKNVALAKSYGATAQTIQEMIAEHALVPVDGVGAHPRRR